MASCLQSYLQSNFGGLFRSTVLGRSNGEKARILVDVDSCANRFESFSSLLLCLIYKLSLTWALVHFSVSSKIITQKYFGAMCSIYQIWPSSLTSLFFSDSTVGRTEIGFAVDNGLRCMSICDGSKPSVRTTMFNSLSSFAVIRVEMVKKCGN